MAVKYGISCLSTEQIHQAVEVSLPYSTNIPSPSFGGTTSQGAKRSCISILIHSLVSAETSKKGANLCQLRLSNKGKYNKVS